MEEPLKMAEEILISVCETDEILEDPDMDLLEAGYLDSFALIQVIIMIEERTGISLQPTDINKEDISSISSLSRFIKDVCKQ